MTYKYDGKDYPCAQLAKWAQAYGEKPQPEWVHLFYHTLDIVSMNWYVEIELRHGTCECDILCEGFMMTFNFENGFESIDEALQEVKATIFRILQDPLDLIQPEWTTQLSHVLQCYNVTAEEEDEDLWKINILETEDHCEDEGPHIENLDITTSLKKNK